MNFELRGVKYPIVNDSDILLVKLEAALQNRFASPKDDESAAYVMKKACPSIPSNLVDYKNGEFELNLNAVEIAVFSLHLSIAVLQRTKTNNPSDKRLIEEKIKSIQQKIAEVGDTSLTPEQIKLLSEDLPTQAIAEPVRALAEPDPSWQSDEISELEAKLARLKS